MKQVTLMVAKNDVEYILDTIVKYRLELMEDESEFSEKYRDSLSNTGYLLELINSQYADMNSDESITVTFDIESYLNMFDVLSHKMESLNKSIIEALKMSDSKDCTIYEEEKCKCQRLYNQINKRRFEVLHL